MREPEPNFSAAPPLPAPTGALSTPAHAGDSTGGLIPYKNSSALMAYYIGLFSALPLLGFPMGIVAVVLGVKGLRYAQEKPEVKGKIHAWIGIVCGAFWALFHGALLVLLAVALLKPPSG